MRKSQEKLFWRIAIPVCVAIVIAMNMAFAQAVQFVPAPSCETIEKAKEFANAAANAEKMQSTLTCEMRMLAVPDNPNMLTALHTTHGVQFSFIVIEANYPDGIRYSIVAVIRKGKDT